MYMKIEYAFTAMSLMILAILIHAVLYQFESKAEKRKIVIISGYLRFVVLILSFICLGIWE